MRRLLGLLGAIPTRLLPALLTALGVVLITAGLLSYWDPATTGAVSTPTPGAGLASPSPDASTPVDVPSTAPSDQPSGSPGASGSPAAGAVVTRVVVPALQIDLPVVKAPSGYPYCNVAMYFGPPMGQPGEGRATYIFAHARDGMFGPIYEIATVQGAPQKLVGMIVQVYTSDNMLYLYEVTQAKVHQLSLEEPATATTEQLWLQTSEGPKGTPGKTQLVATPLSVGAADPADAHPAAHPVVCG